MEVQLFRDIIMAMSQFVNYVFILTLVPKTKHSTNCKKAGYWNGCSAGDVRV